MTKEEIYKQLVQLSTELSETGLPERVFTAAQDGNIRKVQRNFDDFKKQKHELYKEITDFGDFMRDILKLGDESPARIFGKDIEFDASEIDASSLIILAYLGNFGDDELFEQWNEKDSEAYILSISEAGYSYLAQFISHDIWMEYVKGEYSFADFLVDVFAGKYK